MHVLRHNRRTSFRTSLVFGEGSLLQIESFNEEWNICICCTFVPFLIEAEPQAQAVPLSCQFVHGCAGCLNEAQSALSAVVQCAPSVELNQGRINADVELTENNFTIEIPLGNPGLNRTHCSLV